MNTYARLPIAFTHGEGIWLWDSNGKKYLDTLSGIAVNTLGHAHPRFTAALSAQINKLIHVSNIYQIPEQQALADATDGPAVDSDGCARNALNQRSHDAKV